MCDETAFLSCTRRFCLKASSCRGRQCIGESADASPPLTSQNICPYMAFYIGMCHMYLLELEVRHIRPHILAILDLRRPKTSAHFGCRRLICEVNFLAENGLRSTLNPIKNFLYLRARPEQTHKGCPG